MRYLILFLFTFYYNIGHSQTTVIKLNPNDCVACTNNINTICNLDTGYRFIVKNEYEEQLDDLIYKFNLSSNINKYIFSDSLYKIYDTHMFSEVFILNNKNKIKWSSTLKEFNVELFKSNLKKTIPVNNKIKSFVGGVVIENTLTSRFYCENKLKQMIDLKEPTIISFKEKYNKLFQSNTPFEIYNESQAFDSKLKPTITTILDYDTSNNVKYIYKTFYPESIKGNDTFFNSIIWFVKSNNLNYEISLIDISKLPKEYTISEYSFISNNDFLYCKIILINKESNKVNDYKLIAQFEKVDTIYRFKSILPYTLDTLLVNSDLKYNFQEIHHSQNYFTTSLTQNIYSYDTLLPAIKPIPRKWISENKNAMQDYKLNYYLYDIKEYDKTITILYEHDNNFYIGTVSEKGILKETKIFNTIERKELMSICLSNNNKSYYYTKKGVYYIFQKSFK